MVRPKPEEEAGSIKLLFRRSDIDKINLIERLRDHAIDILKPINKKSVNLKDFDYAVTFCLEKKPKTILLQYALDLLRACISALESGKVDQYHIDWIVTKYHALSIKEQDKKTSSKGGKKPKIRQPILLAIIQYLQNNPKYITKPNNQIAERLKVELDKNKLLEKGKDLIIVNYNGCEWDFYFYENLFWADPDTHNHTKYRLISIESTALRKTYIPKAKEEIKKIK